MAFGGGHGLFLQVTIHGRYQARAGLSHIVRCHFSNIFQTIQFVYTRLLPSSSVPHFSTYRIVQISSNRFNLFLPTCLLLPSSSASHFSTYCPSSSLERSILTHITYPHLTHHSSQLTAHLAQGINEKLKKVGGINEKLYRRSTITIDSLRLQRQSCIPHYPSTIHGTRQVQF